MKTYTQYVKVEVSSKVIYIIVSTCYQIASFLALAWSSYRRLLLQTGSYLQLPTLLLLTVAT